MRKSFLSLLALLFCTGLWALDDVPYVDAEGNLQTADGVTVLTNSMINLSGWYIVNGEDVQTTNLNCVGAVHLILADGAKLTATGDSGNAGIRVSGEENSLTIYGQENQSGELFANGGNYGAGIGGGFGEGANNITINGGIVWANAGSSAAGIGGGSNANGCKIRINGGTVWAAGDVDTDCIGSPWGLPSWDIYVSEACVVMADNDTPPTTVIPHTSTTDFGSEEYFYYQRYAHIFTPETVPYIDENGEQQYAFEVTEITHETTELTSGWYVVNDADVRTGMLVCNGDVHLILADGAKLTATGGYEEAGIRVSGEDNSLAIYGQEGQTGQLIANAGNTSGAAGIGGLSGEDGSHITISGGIITATGHKYNADAGAGIGGGTEGDGFDITIHGGVVTAKSERTAAGIGGGDGGSGYNITITGGTVTATATGSGAAGIGGSSEKSGHDISISGGQVTATGGKDAAGIGGGCFAGANNISITGGRVIANAGSMSSYFKSPSAIGHGAYFTSDPAPATSGITVDASLELRAGTQPTLDENTIIEHTSFTDVAGSISSKRYASVDLPGPIFVDVTYVDEDGDTHTVEGAGVIVNSVSELNEGWYVVRGPNVEVSNLVCNGAVNLILADGAKLTATGSGGQAGVRVSGEGTSLTIYGQEAQTGELVAICNGLGAAIGGGEYEVGHDITINGGKVTATGPTGIGGGYNRDGYNITINAGTVTATGGSGAGIGGGFEGNGYNITINGGTVSSEGDSGIGAGRYGAGHDITINGGKVTAKSNYIGCGIGSGSYGRESGDGYNIYITGGSVMAIGGVNAIALGGFYGHDIYVSEDCTLKADNNNPPTTEIYHYMTRDVADDLKSSCYVQIEAIPYVYDVPYIDADGSLQSATKAREVTDETVKLFDGWYVVRGTNVQTTDMECVGTVRLILADGAKLTANGTDMHAAIRANIYGCSLIIYGQEDQTGELVATAHEGAGIGGGRWEDGGDITINGGVVKVTGGNRSAGIGGGHNGTCAYVTINGGTVIANTTSTAGAIGAGEYGSAATSIKVAGELVVKAGSEYVAHQSSVDIATALSGKKPVVITPGFTLTAHYAEDQDAYYTTFYHSQVDCHISTEDVTIYTAALGTQGAEKYLNLYEVAGDVIPAGTAVILRSETESTLKLDNYPEEVAGVTVPNDLIGTNDGTTVAANSVYTLAAEDGELAFYKYSGTAIPANKAYLQLPAGVSAPRRIGFVRPIPTEVEYVSDSVNANKVLRDGQLLIRKNGHLYNAQGVVIE